MFIDNQVPRDIRDIEIQMAELVARELDGLVARAQSARSHFTPVMAYGSSKGDGKVLHYANAHPEEANQHHNR